MDCNLLRVCVWGRIKQLLYIHAQCSGNFAQYEQRRVTHAAFHLANIGPIQLRTEGERFLRQSFLTSPYSNVVRKLLAYLIIVPCHGNEHEGGETINPRIIFCIGRAVGRACRI